MQRVSELGNQAAALTLKIQVLHSQWQLEYTFHSSIRKAKTLKDEI